MSTQETVFRIFASSPNDVAEERESLESVVRELNLTHNGPRIDLVRWETHAFPGVAQDAQQVINQAIDDDYDILVGIMWTRLGTPTSRADSGTVEEFERAYARFQHDPSAVRIMFYFKDAPLSPSKLDPIQLTAVNEFRERISTLGVLHWRFQSSEEFAQLLRLHIPRQIAALWSAGEQRHMTAHDEPVATSAQADLNEEGYLDLLEMTEDGFARSTEIMQKMTELIQELGAKIQMRTAELEAVPAKHGQIDIRAMRRIGDHAARDMDEFSSRVDEEMSLLMDAYNLATSSASRAITMVLDVDSEQTTDLDGVSESVTEFNGTMTEVLESVAEFRSTVAATPRMTTKLNRARKRAVLTLDTMLDNFARLGAMAQEVADAVSDARRSHGGSN